MKKDENKLLLMDICCRIQHGLKMEFDSKVYDVVGCFGERLIIILPFMSNWESQPVELCKPYLRSMSTMTEEEMDDLMVELRVCKKDIQNCGHTEIYGYTLVFQEWEKKTFFIPSKAIDYLNSHHLDYRGLIKKGLAIEAPEGMY